MVLTLLWIGIANAQEPLKFTQIVDTPDQAIGALFKAMQESGELEALREQAVQQLLREAKRKD
jgi:hypothetical protein